MLIVLIELSPSRLTVFRLIQNKYTKGGPVRCMPCPGAFIPSEAIMHFQISLCFRKKISDSAENFPNLILFPTIFRFSFAKISDDHFLVIHHKFRISPLFSPVSIHFLPLFRKLFLSPLLLQNFHP